MSLRTVNQVHRHTHTFRFCLIEYAKECRRGMFARIAKNTCRRETSEGWKTTEPQQRHDGTWHAPTTESKAFRHRVRTRNLAFGRVRWYPAMLDSEHVAAPARPRCPFPVSLFTLPCHPFASAFIFFVCNSCSAI